MDKIWFWRDVDDMYGTIAGFALVILGCFLTKYFWKWYKEVKYKRPSVSQSNALQGFFGGIILLLAGLMLLYYSFVLPFLNN